MIRYAYKKPKLLFVGINPHPGSFARGVPFSNNKTFWYLMNRAGLLREKEADLRDDKQLKAMYQKRFASYGLGFVNIINRPTVDVTRLRRGEELAGRARIFNIIRKEKPPVVCFVGKVTYQKFSGNATVDFGWQENIFDSRSFVMHFPLRGEARIRIREFRIVGRGAGILR